MLFDHQTGHRRMQGELLAPNGITRKRYATKYYFGFGWRQHADVNGVERPMLFLWAIKNLALASIFQKIFPSIPNPATQFSQRKGFFLLLLHFKQ
jgi:hypothetical protein